MIIGIGTDLCDISRIEKTLQRFGDRFLNKTYRHQEQQRAARRPAKQADRLAQMFAAKEACSKALGTGLRNGVWLTTMEVVPLPSGKPTLQLHGGALARLEALTPAGMVPHLDVSLTDESGLAHAMVVISAVPKEWKIERG
ncbi:holo-ACP synthase [Aestuariispira insulae]|uniref:Holo-[acyl-carrier-protein] synthase n=1 Tax=Aestuariispira insulae TaxID=1461337 RepID=A0A3D9HN45_9PROT|nr:holo-ACP synthase [Aestuariispira insulae]RED50889.1 holo-[acyl-carrier protein] synthase [Aestuariispira insulae]